MTALKTITTMPFHVSGIRKPKGRNGEKTTYLGPKKMTISRIQAPNRSTTIAGKPMTSHEVKLIPVSASLYILQFKTFPALFDISQQFLHVLNMYATVMQRNH